MFSLFLGPIWFYVNHSLAYTHKLLGNVSQVSDVDYGPDLVDVVDLVDGSAEGLVLYWKRTIWNICTSLRLWHPQQLNAKGLYEGGHDMWWVPAKIGLKG